MADMTIKEIEELAERLERRRKAHQFFAERVKVEIGKKAHSEASDDFEEAASAIRQLLNAQKWKRLDLGAKGNDWILGYHENSNKTLPIKWDRIACVFLTPEDHFIDEDDISLYCSLPLPTPPEEKENGDA